MGLIAYNSLDRLPVVPLGTLIDSGINLPVRGMQHVIETLSILSSRGCTMHDGFHLLSARSGDLTHIAQFVSPPLRIALENPAQNWPLGARQMTALLISTLPQVDFSVVISAEGSLHLYENGKQQTSGVLK